MTGFEFCETYLDTIIGHREMTSHQMFVEFKRSLSNLGIAKHLSIIAETSPYISYIKYAKYEFQLEKLSAIKYKQVGDKFLADYEKSVFYKEGKDFSITALMLLLRYSVNEINDFIESGLLEVGETAKSIREKIKNGVLKNG